MDVLARRGAREIMAELFTEPMRYIDLKKQTDLPDGTLTTRIKELLEFGLIEQKPQTDETGRYYLAYDIEGGEETRRMYKIGFEWAVTQMAGERLLEEAHVKAIRSSDLPEKQKEIAEEYFVRKFQEIKELINVQCTKAYGEAMSLARASSV